MKPHIRLYPALLLMFMTGIWLSTSAYADTTIVTTTTTTKSTAKVSHKSHHHARSHGRFAPTIPATGRGVFIFDPRRVAWAAYNSEGKLVRTGAGSGGRNYCPDLHRRCHTPTGTFRVYAIQGASCKSKKFPIPRGGAPMPYCAYFHGGYAIHGSYHVPGYNASHGCIRVHPGDAAWLTRNILRPGSTVIVRPY